MDCRMRDNDVFCAVSFSDTLWSAVFVLLIKNVFVGNAGLGLRTQPATCLEHPTAPVHVP